MPCHETVFCFRKTANHYPDANYEKSGVRYTFSDCRQFNLPRSENVYLTLLLIEHYHHAND